MAKAKEMRSLQPLNKDWVKTAELLNYFDFTANHLYNLSSDGVLKEGKHWINVAHPNAMRRRYRWHLKRCLEVFKVPAEHREV